MKGIAEIEIYNHETGETIKYEEHNSLSPLLSNIFEDDLYDGCMQRNRDLSQYFKKLVLWKDQIDDYTAIAPDNCELLDVLTATTTETINDNDYYGYKYSFTIPQATVGTIKCISLAPDGFINTNKSDYSWNSLIEGSRSMSTGVGNYLFKIDFDNSYLWTLSFDTLSNKTYGGNNKYRVYINKYYHNFKEICLFSNDILNAKLLETTTIDATAILDGINPTTTTGYIRYAIDETNNNLVIMYKEGINIKKVNILAVNIDDTSIFEVHNMTFPANLSPAGTKNNNPIAQLPIYHGRLLFNCLYSDDDGERRYITGLNYLDSTDYILYNSVVPSGADLSIFPLSNCKQILGTGEENCISEYLFCKNNTAYVHNSFTAGTGSEFYYKSKIIRVNGSAFFYTLSPYDISTINNLSKAIIKTSAETIKITYKVLEKKVKEEE